MILKYATAAALTACAVTPATASSPAWLGFCSMAQQVSSNAGDCPTCRLMIADNPETQMYFIEANNGWSAELFFVEGDESVAAGSGAWGRVGGAYERAAFDIDVNRQGDQLFLTMTHHNRSLGTVRASFVCLN